MLTGSICAEPPRGSIRPSTLSSLARSGAGLFNHSSSFNQGRRSSAATKYKSLSPFAARGREWRPG